MWTEEDEEKFVDLEIMNILLKPKRTVKGDFLGEMYIVEKKVEFSQYSFFDQQVKLYLPEGTVGEHKGEEIFYVDDMGEYIEYVSEDNKLFFTIEKGNSEIFGMDSDEYFDLEAFYDDYIDNLEDNNIDLEAYIYEKHKLENMNVDILNIMIENDDLEFYGYIFYIYKEENIYRFYIGTFDYSMEVIEELGKRIVQEGVF